MFLHFYHQTAREDSEFWRYCKHMEVPDSLTHKMELFAASGRVGRDVDDLFRDASWVQVMLGQGIIPEEEVFNYAQDAEMMRQRIKGGAAR